MTEIKRLKYTDSTGTVQVLGVLQAPVDQVPNSPNAKAKLKNIKISRTPRGFNTAKVWATSQIYGEVPVSAADFNSSEPEIFLQYYDRSTGSWVDEMRLYAENQGGIKSDGEVAFKLYTHSKRTGKQNANKTTSTTTNIVDAFDSVLPADYTAVAPAEEDIAGSYPGVNDYTLVSERRTGYRELTKDHDWFFRFTPDTDGSGNYEVFLAPVGYEGPVDTIQSKEDYVDGNVLAKKVKEWEKGRTKDIVNKVEVIGKDGNGAKIVGTASSAGSISDYGERFKRYKPDYRITSTTEAENIAADQLSLSPGEGGEVKTEMFTDPVVGKTFNVEDSVRNINGEFTVMEQVNFYPEHDTKLTFTYESEIEKRAGKDDELESERNNLYPDSSESFQTSSYQPDVSGQSGEDAANVSGSAADNNTTVSGNAADNNTTVSGNAADNNTTVSGSSGDNSPIVGGYTGTNMSSASSSNPLDQSYFGMSSGDTFSDSVSVPSLDEDEVIVIAWFSVQARATNTDFVGGQTTIENTDTGTTLYSDSNSPSYSPADIRNHQVVEVGSSLGGNSIYFQWEMTSGSDQDMRFSYGVNVIGEHDHPGYSDGGSLQSVDHGHGDGTLGADDHSHSDGTLGADDHGHSDGTLGADDHSHSDGTLGADNHPHGDGSYTAEDHDHGAEDVETSKEDNLSR